MSTAWYYVDRGNRVGPIGTDELSELISNQVLGADDLIWKKGFTEWTKVSQVAEFSSQMSGHSMVVTEKKKSDDSTARNSAPFNWVELSTDEKIFYVQVGLDRGAPPVTYGPYCLDMLVRLFQEKRINEKTFVWCKGMSNWSFLSDLPIYAKFFSGSKTEIEDSDRRNAPRRPFVARIFFHNNQHLFEGLCRDISVGGVQVLVSDFPGKVGERINMNIHPDNSDLHFVASGEIVRKLEGNQGFSLRFINLLPEAQDMIKSYISGET